MSKKHHQRTRAEKLARRDFTGIPMHRVKIKASRYMPHIGAKEQERAKRLYESSFVNECYLGCEFTHRWANFIDYAAPRAVAVLCQMSKKQFERQALSTQSAVL